MGMVEDSKWTSAKPDPACISKSSLSVLSVAGGGTETGEATHSAAAKAAPGPPQSRELTSTTNEALPSSVLKENWKMKSQLKNFIVTVVATIGLLGLWSCGSTVGKDGASGPAGMPGSIMAEFHIQMDGVIPAKCTTAQAITWTASSRAGATQTKTSPAITASDNRFSKCDASAGGAAICYCAVETSFVSLAPGTWTVQANEVTCSVKVIAGNTTMANLFTGGRPCVASE